MDDWLEHDHRLIALAMRVAALEDNVAFLEEWCEEQQDVLDRHVGSPAFAYEVPDEPAARVVLHVVDLRDHIGAAEEVDLRDNPRADSPMAVRAGETEHDRKVRQIRARIDRLRGTMANSGTPPAAQGSCQ